MVRKKILTVDAAAELSAGIYQFAEEIARIAVENKSCNRDELPLFGPCDGFFRTVERFILESDKGRAFLRPRKGKRNRKARPTQQAEQSQ